MDAVDRVGQDYRKMPGVIVLPRAIFLQHLQAHNGQNDFPIRSLPPLGAAGLGPGAAINISGRLYIEPGKRRDFSIV